MKERGFTIIEVLVSVVLFAVVMLCGMSIFSFAHNILVRAREQSYALQIAKNQMSLRDTRDVGGCPIFKPGDPLCAPRSGVHYVPELNITFNSVFSWEQVNDPFGASAAVYDWYKAIHVVVTWHSNVDNADRTLSLHTAGVYAPYHG